jgi:cell division protein ZipA
MPMPARVNTLARNVVEIESNEKTIEAQVQRPGREQRFSRIEPTFNEASVTAELPVHEEEPIVAVQPPVSVPKPAAVATDAPTLSMSNTPAPRRIERRKIIALRLAAGPQRLSGEQLKDALESESLQHGKYDVFHRLDEHGAPMFSVASMVEPGTFNLDKMAQETFPGITMFTQLPGPVAGMFAFNELVACSRRLHAALGGTLQDERGVPLTVHRVERIRHEIRDFELRPAAESQRTNPAYPSSPE